MEKLLPLHSAIETENRYRVLLKATRARDAAAGRTLDGPHLSDLRVIHAGLTKEMTGFAPILLLDEIVAHLDPARRVALYDALSSLGAQVWMTGADPAAFGDIVGRAQVFEVHAGTVRPTPAKRG